MEKNSIKQNAIAAKSIISKSFQLIFNCFLFALALIPMQMHGQSTTTTFDSAAIYTWTAPAGITSITVQAWGGGGGGASTGAANGSGGGGGGAYTTSIMSVIPGTTYTLQVGAGGAKGSGTCTAPTNGADGTNSWFNTPATLFANAGKGGKAPVGIGAAGIGGIGGAASTGSGITSYNGGDGSVGGVSIVLSPGGGGGGGSAAGTGAAGVNGDPAVAASGQTLGGGGGIAPSGGGYGGQGGGYNNMNGLLSGVDGFAPGGGGGGAGNGSNPSCIGGLTTIGGNGAHGRIIIITGQAIFNQTSSWTAPACITSVIVEAWGGGGAGGGNETTEDGGGGGGGGAYSKSVISVTPGQTYAVTVGTGGAGLIGGTGATGGDSWFINATTILAKGGTGGNPPVAGAAGIAGLGGLASAGIGTTKFSGGDGGNGNNATVGFGGGGGSSAGYGANGTVGGDAGALATVIIPAPGGIAPNGGGNGGDGQNTLLSGNGQSGFTPGGGGGGSSDIETGSGVSGGQGANGQIILSYPNPTLIIGDNPVPAANVCANTLNVPIHGFTLTGANGCDTETDIRFVTTGTYTASEILDYKIYYTTTNTFATTNYLTTISTSTGVGTHSFPSISRLTGNTYYYWITMDVAPVVIDGHTIGVNATLPANITAIPSATGSGAASGIQTLKAAPVLNSTLTPPAICSGTTFTYTPTSITSPTTFTWSRATIIGITPVGTSNSGNVNEVLSNSTPDSINVIYVYKTTSSSTNCTSAGENVIVKVNPKPQGSVTGNSRCGADPTSLGRLTWISTAGVGPYTLVYNPGLVTEPSVVSATSFSVTPNPAATTTYTITSVTDVNGCVSTTNFTRDTASITVTSAPIVINTNPKDTTVCAGVGAAFTISASGVFSYGWEVSTNHGGTWTNVTIATGHQPTYSNATTSTLNLSATDTTHNGYVYRALLSAACGAAITTSGTATLTVNPIPVLSSSVTPTTICSGTTFSYTPNSATVGATFSWSRATIAGITEPGTTGFPNIHESLTNTTNAPIDVTYVIITTASSCSNTPGENIIATINPSPVLSSSLKPAAICSGTTFTYSPTSVTPDSAFTWVRATIPGISEPGTSGPNNISEPLTNITSAPIAVKYVYTTTSGNCSVGGAGDSVIVNVNPDGNISLTSPVGTDSQSVCINNAINTITYNIGGSGINASSTGLPPGVIGTFNAGVFTLSGTPNSAGVYSYTVNTIGNCTQTSATGTVTVGISLISSIGADDQSVCLNTPINDIEYAVGGAGEGAGIVGLPAGITSGFNAVTGIFTITGTPTVAGEFDYTVTTTGSCSASTITGTITVGISLISVIGTDSQSVCLGSPITNITYKIVGGDTPVAAVEGLPPGVTGSLTSPGVFTIIGTPTVEGLFNYTVYANGSCAFKASLTGKILVSIGRVSLVGTDSQKVCKNTSIIPIVYSIVGGASPTYSGLPAGVSGSLSSPGKFTISGLPSIAGAFTYTISALGTCALPAHLTGRIIVGVGLISAIGTDSQHVCKNAPIDSIHYSIVGGDSPAPTVLGLPAGFTAAFTSPGIFTITGTPTIAGLISYTLSTNGSCSAQSTLTGKITVGIGLTSATGTDNTQIVCKNTPITKITYSVVGGGITTVDGLPAGLTGATTTPGDPAIFTISGMPDVAGTFNYLVSTTGGTCSPSAVAGVIKVNDATVSPTSNTLSTTQTICANTPIKNITYNIGGTATGATLSPNNLGLTGQFAAGVFTINGTPDGQLQPGPYSFTITTTGGVCAQNSSVFTIIILNPIANFTADTLIGNAPLLVDFINESQNSNTYSWTLGDGAQSGVENTSNGYITPGTYTVILTASKDSLCPDTASALVIIREGFSVIIPNIFTPNGDNVNDIYSIIAVDIEKLDVEIYDRWGLKLFEWHTNYGGWDGRSAKSGVECTAGVYYYIVYAKGNNGKEVNKTGFFNLIR